MIGYLKGTVQFSDLDAVCIVVGGVGYRVLMPLPDLARLSKPGSDAEAYIHTHVREDAIVLYGFSSRDSLSLFERLTGCPASARARLSRSCRGSTPRAWCAASPRATRRG